MPGIDKISATYSSLNYNKVSEMKVLEIFYVIRS